MFKTAKQTLRSGKNSRESMQLLPLLLVAMLQLDPVGAAETSSDANEWVKAADSYRQNAENLKVNTRVRLFKKGQLDKERLYEVYIKPDRKSLVLFQSRGEKGQKVLMIADKFWMIMPKSRRPIRITPMQKLLGDASTGDIATMRWHEDYDAVFEAEEVIDSKKLNILKLTSTTKGVSYKSIRLFLEQDSHKPVKAELYVSSGKLAKNAEFVITHTGDREQVSKMVLTDVIQKGKITEVEYMATEPYSLSDKYYNPQFLAKKPSLLVK